MEFQFLANICFKGDEKGGLSVLKSVVSSDVKVSTNGIMLKSWGSRLLNFVNLVFFFN